MFAATERRLAAEWALLLELASHNHGRLTGLYRDGTVFRLQLHGPAAMSIPKREQPDYLSVHDVVLDFPVHFPAVPMEMHLRTPVVHPNVHPETGFVCLWDRHRVSNTVELALHKLVSMLAGELWNREAPHVMQPEALPVPRSAPMPLQGVRYEPPPMLSRPGEAARRRRLL